jgi:hypothetical protein
MKTISLQQYIKHVWDNNTVLCHFTMWSSGTITSILPFLQLQECHELGNCFNPSTRCVSFSLLQTNAPEIPVSTCSTLSIQLTLCQTPIGEVKLYISLKRKTREIGPIWTQSGQTKTGLCRAVDNLFTCVQLKQHINKDDKKGDRDRDCTAGTKHTVPGRKWQHPNGHHTRVSSTEGQNGTIHDIIITADKPLSHLCWYSNKHTSQGLCYNSTVYTPPTWHWDQITSTEAKPIRRLVAPLWKKKID